MHARFSARVDSVVVPACGERTQRRWAQTNPSIVTMVLPIVAAAARRRVGMMTKQQMQKRSFAHAPAKEWEGIDKVVRGYFPHDHQRA
jgi:hypothetical protein